MNILHVNSYYIAAPLYKNLYDQQYKDMLQLEVYVPYNSKIKDIKKEFGKYTTLSNDFSTLDRAFFFRKHKKIFYNIEKKYDIKKHHRIT